MRAYPEGRNIHFVIPKTSALFALSAGVFGLLMFGALVTLRITRDEVTSHSLRLAADNVELANMKSALESCNATAQQLVRDCMSEPKKFVAKKPKHLGIGGDE